MSQETSTRIDIHTNWPGSTPLDQLSGREYTTDHRANSKEPQSTYSAEAKSDLGHLLDKGLGVAKAVAGALFSITGMGCTTEFKKTHYDSWEEDDMDELDSPADEVDFLDGPDAEDPVDIDAADSEDPDIADAEEEEPATIVCGKIGSDVKLSNAAESFVNPSLGWSGSGSR